MRGRHLTWLAVLAALAMMAACGTGSSSPAPPSGSTRPSGQAGRTVRIARGRFTVVLDGAAIEQVGVITRALDHVDALLPGPKTTIMVSGGPPGALLPQTGFTSHSNPETGHITVVFGPTPQIGIGEVLALWLPRAFSHEIDHSVRILAGPGYGTTLLPQLISEGISSAFDEAAFPGPPNPWDRAISSAQECTLWHLAQSQLNDIGRYNEWMLGADNVPHWTGFTIGYHIVQDYRARHPQVSWSALTATSATTILAGSDYQPCP